VEVLTTLSVGAASAIALCCHGVLQANRLRSTLLFLSALEIVEALRVNAIRLAYYSVRRLDGTTLHLSERRYVTVDDSPADDEIDRLVRATFFESLEPDSLAFHVGPYAAVEFKRSGDQKPFLKDREGQRIFDIKSYGTLTILPGEFALVGTNEYVEMSHAIGASLYSNVRNTDVGLSHISTMIDPSWHGKLQIGISNPTRFSKQLKHLDPISILRFHRLSQTPPQFILERFRTRRPHFGDDWWTMEAEPGRRLFEMRMEYSPGGDFARRIAAELRSEKAASAVRTAAKSVGVVALVGSIFFLAGLYNRIEDTADYRERILVLEQQQTTLDDMARTFHVITTGSTTIGFGNTRVVEFVLPFGVSLPIPPFVVVDLPGVASRQYETSIQFQSTTPGSTNVNAAVVRISLVDPTLALQSTTATWLVARPRD
jgi:deoxycytidine triphosphate deaminase